MTIKAVIFQAEAEPFVPPGDQAELALNAASYSNDEDSVIQFTILRTVDTTERVSVNWAITNASVTPSSGVATFEIGSSQEVIAVTASDIGPTEVGNLALSNPQNLTTPSNPPALINPSSATFTIIDNDIYINFINTINLDVSETHDMSQYMVDDGGNISDSWMDNHEAIASYDSVTRLLTGVTIGSAADVTLSITDQSIAPATVTIPAATTTYNATALNPGDIIQLEAGARPGLQIVGIDGSAADPIIVRNDPFASFPTIIEKDNTSTGYFFRLNNCENFILDGSLKYVNAPSGVLGIDTDWTEGKTQAGIIIRQINSIAPVMYIITEGYTQKFVMRGVEVDGNNVTGGSSGIGMYINDHAENVGDARTVREDIEVYNCYFHDLGKYGGTGGGEGIYAGPNYQLASDNSTDDLPLKDIDLHHNIFENTGRTGAQFKTALSGVNRMHHNVSRNCGDDAANEGDYGHPNGLHVDGSIASIYNNKVFDSGGYGIALRNQYVTSAGFAEAQYECYNNLVVRPGTILNTNGIYAWKGGTHPDLGQSTVNVKANIYNNTVVDASQQAINYNGDNGGVSGGVARDNIVCGTNASIGTNGGANTSTNNRTGTILAQAFEDANNDDYRLTVSSPAVDDYSGSGAPSTDLNDNLRDATPDQGCYEYVA